MPTIFPGASSPPPPLLVNPSAPAIYAAPAGAGPIPPPPSGKYCVRCRTIISRAAVYCPVCQQPQIP